MKKNYLALLLGALTALASFTSCTDDDDVKGMVLSGEWRGDFDMYYDYQYSWGDVMRFWATETYLEFIPYSNSYNSGYGYQVDFYDDYDSPYDEIYHSFKWEVRYGTIYMYYRGEEEWDTYLRDYHMTNDRLTGYFEDTSNRFSLWKLTDYYDWTPYINAYGDYNSEYGYGYGRPGYYYRKTPTKTSSGEQVEPGKIIHYGNGAVDGRGK